MVSADEAIIGQASQDSTMHLGPHRLAGPSHDLHTGHDTTADRVGCPRSGARLRVQSHIHSGGYRHPGGTSNGDNEALHSNSLMVELRVIHVMVTDPGTRHRDHRRLEVTIQVRGIHRAARSMVRELRQWMAISL